MPENRPLSRKKNITEGGGNAVRRGEGLGGGPGGRGDGFGGNGASGRNTSASHSSYQSQRPQQGSVPTRGSGGGRGLLPIIIAVVVALLGGGGGLGAYLSNANAGGYDHSPVYEDLTTTQVDTDMPEVNEQVASGAREKRTVIYDNGKDTTTIMVYLCGTDLESRSAMASKDLQEMLAADLGENINLLVYTGGCKQWQNNVVSSRTNQIYQIKDNKMVLLQDNLGSIPMTDPVTLTDFIKWCAKNYPANRYDLIFWDHGGGSVSGYGYDEKFAKSGSMTLSGIDQALKNSGVTFDFIGFDACLMATVETALVVDHYGDYMIASEETEPGVGWYYTDWLDAYGKNPSMETLSIGKNIIDSYTKACSRICPGQKTTLSMVDLAELSATVPKELSDFAKETSRLISEDQYHTVSNARSGTREFAASNKIDQIDLVDFADRMGTVESRQLANAIKGAVKYNLTSSNMSNAYGLSIYFPWKKTSAVDGMVNTYEAIGMDEDYTRCIQEFAALGTAGQIAAGGSATASPVSSLFGSLLGSGVGASDLGSADVVGQLLSGFLSGGSSDIDGLTSANTTFFGRNLDVDQAARYIADHHFDPENLYWQKNADGQQVLMIPDEQWKWVEELDLSLYYDDGEGYLDLGIDNTFDFDSEGNLLAPSDRTWLAINGQVVPYYKIDQTGNEDDYCITGRIPAELNGERINLIVMFDTAHENGFVAGASYDYQEGETDTVAKNLTALTAGDTLTFICDYYTYDKEYEDRYVIGNPVTVKEDMSELVISNVNVGANDLLAMYRFTDIYDQVYWSEAIKE